MINIQIFIVFHKTIFDECYRNIPDNILQKYFTFFAVNKNIVKCYSQNKYKVVNEWDLPIYDKTFQERGYNENSAIYHVYANDLHKDYKYIGFFQYDMVLNGNIIDVIQKTLTQTPTLLSFARFDFNFCTRQSWNEPGTLNYIIKDYENFFNKPFTKKSQYPLYNSYIIPNETYEKIMKWIVQLYNKIYPWCVQAPNASHFGHIGGIYERIMGFAIGEEYLDYTNIDVKHDYTYKHLASAEGSLVINHNN